jgi:nondiscriminating aspartyl-tRNA synthetase
VRSDKVRAIFKIEAEICHAFRQFLKGQDFVEIHSPKIVATGTEGGAQLFAVDYLGKPAYLAQSPQFYKQIMVGAYERVFEIACVYRAEEHDTSRHLNEYVSMDIEMGFIEGMQDLIAMQTRLLRHIMEHLKEFCPRELALFGASVPEITVIPQITLYEACQIVEAKLKGAGKQAAICDLDPEGERVLCEHFAQTEGTSLVYVTQYPRSARPFYAMPEADGQATHSFDLIFNGLEITTGGQRIHSYDMLKESITSRGLDAEKFKDYLQCFAYGMPPHGGLAIGLERLTKQLLGLASVKFASLFPRDLNRISP